MFKILKAGNHIFDIFWGDGWYNWCRIMKKGGHLIKQGGSVVPEHIWSIANKEIK